MVLEMGKVNQIIWREQASVNAIKLARDSGEISREEYWNILNGRFSCIKDLVEIATRENLEFRLNHEGIEVDIPLGIKETFVRMVLDVEDIRSVPFTVMAEGPYENFQAKILFALGKQSMSFIDAGANMGYYSLALSKLNPNLSVFSFEPQPKTYSLLQRNIQLNAVNHQIETHNLGLGSKEESLLMYIPAFTGSGGGSFANLHSDEERPIEFEVPVKTLDQILPRDRSVDLIKIDVEGFEYEMLIGSMVTIREFKPSIVVELLRKWMKPFSKHPQDVITLLNPLGYEVYSIGKNSLIPITSIDDNTAETNFVFLHKENTSHINSVREFVQN